MHHKNHSILFTPVDGPVTITQFDEELIEVDSTFNIPISSWYAFPNNIKIPVCCPKTLIKYINDNLLKIEGVRYEYLEDRYIWNLEYGTRPIEHTLDENNYSLFNIICIKKHAAILAAFKAHKMFPSLTYGYDDPYDLEPIHLFGGFYKWCHMIISLSYSEKDNSILLELRNNRGDTSSFYALVRIIKNYFNQTTTKNWLKRVDYLMFTEGIEYQGKNHIHRYLFDEMVKREICSFL